MVDSRVVDIRARHLVLLDVPAALGFALLVQLEPLRPAAEAGGGAGGWPLSLAAALPLVARRLWPLPVFGFVLIVACAALSYGLGPVPFLAAAYALYPVAVTRRRPGRSAVVVGGVCVAGAALLTLGGGRHYEGGTGAVQGVFGALVLGATWAAGAAVGERRESLRRVIEQTAERAKVEERLRIARDIHDVVTHSVGLIAVKAGIANHVVDTHPDEARDALVVIEDVSRKALRDMRATLTLLRKDENGRPDRALPDPRAPHDLRPVAGLGDLPELVATAEAGGVRVDLSTHCPQQPPDGVATSAYRIVQEALTNTVKHAAPTHCRVRVTARNGLLEIDVDDDGPAPGAAHRPAVPGGGLGLVGMRERATAHGGSLTAGPREGGGFRVAATLPY
ncbi:sensor histidine kinase [Streptomyces sp. VRA16 Mangrove soil]|uniref:sensor histidine kinase n=1 Tax=Streptomyces sp. VRA16 Mangrove soil TaxID=2817434 RepID=UPI001A9DCB19|nr:histidine kinase [Streptomyces sp. VRA16 Mangrove soil]MBO1337235.1 sensor histidine kinase [Streptomyces sp. VRA16 Mangrove soil]